MQSPGEQSVIVCPDINRPGIDREIIVNLRRVALLIV